MIAKLTGSDTLTKGVEILIQKFPVIIGRSSDAGVHFDELWVSRHHCEIHEDDGGLVVRDLGSKFGTCVNRRPIVESRLLPGDVLSVGAKSFLLSYEVPAP